MKRVSRLEADLSASMAAADADHDNSNTVTAAPAVLSGAERRRQKASLRAAAGVEEAPQQASAGALQEAGLGVSLELEKAINEADAGAEAEADDLRQEAPAQRPLKKRRRFGVSPPTAAEAKVSAETPGEDGAPSRAGADTQGGTSAAKSTGTRDETREQAGAESADDDVGMGRQDGEEKLPEVLPIMPGLKVRLKKQKQ